MGESLINGALGGGTSRNYNIRVTVEPPACPGCGSRLKWRHFWKTFWLYSGALGGALMFGRAMMWWQSAWLGGFLLILGIAGPVLWELKWPPAFTITPAGGQTTYEFRSGTYAREFAALNGVTVPPPPPAPASPEPEAPAPD